MANTQSGDNVAPGPPSVPAGSSPRSMTGGKTRPLFLLWVLALTAFDLTLRHQNIESWERAEQVQYLASLIGSVVFWWAAFKLMGNLARRGGGAWAGFGTLLVVLTLSVWTAFAVFFHYGTFPNQDMVVFLANAPGMVFDVMPHIASVRDSALLLGIGVAIGVGAHLSVLRASDWRFGIALPAATLVELVVALSVVNLAPSLPLTSEANTLRFTSQILRWRGAPPPFFKLHPRKPTPLPAGIAGGKPGDFDYLWVVGESMGARYYKAYGATEEFSPRLDGLLQDPANIRLGHLDANSTCTDVSVPSLLSGVDPTSPMAKMVAANLPYDIMKARGYGTFMVSSHKLTWAYLDVFLGDRALDLMQGAEWLHPHPPDNYGAPDSETYDEALRAMDRETSEGKRFYGVVHVRTMHTPYQVDPNGPAPPVEATPSVPSARYRSSMAYFDRMFGDFWDSLQKRPYGDKTIVIFLADHGESFGQHGYYTHCGRYFDEESRVPSFIYAPPAAWKDPVIGPALAQIKANRERHMSALDVFPTFLDLAGVDPKLLSKQLDGYSLARPEPTDRRYVISNCADFRRCPVRTFAFCQNNIKYIYNATTRDWSAFDEAADPDEKTDISAQHKPEIEAAVPVFEKSRVLADLLKNRPKAKPPISASVEAHHGPASGTPIPLRDSIVPKKAAPQPPPGWIR